MKYLPLLLIVILVGCNESRGSNPPGATTCGGHLSGVLWSIGTYACWAGGSAIAAGLLAFGASFIPWIAAFAGGLRSIFLEVALAGFAITLIGCAFLWVGDHPWILGVFTAIMVLAMVLRYRRPVLAFLGFSPAKALT